MRYIPILLPFFTILAVSSFSEHSYADDISALSANRTPQLGSAYQSDRQLLVGGSCVTGSEVVGGPSTSTFSFQNSLSQSEASRELGVEAGGRAQFGVNTLSASAKFSQQSASSNFSISSVWLSDYQLPVAVLAGPTLSAVGKTVEASAGDWARTCGDQYVNEITKGAKLFFSIRIDFNSLEQKQAFEAKFSLAGPLYSANANLSQASREFSRDTKVTVTGLQVGGDVSKLTKIFATVSGGSTTFVSCTLGDYAKCATVVASALDYAADDRSGFPSQLAPGAIPGGSPLIYRTAPYYSIGISDHNYPGLTQVVELARARISDEFSQQMTQKLTLQRLIEFGVVGDRKILVQQSEATTDANLQVLLGASKICYDTPSRCVWAIGSLRLADIDKASLELPPLPTGEYRLITTTKGLWSRGDSLEIMNTPPLSTAPPSSYGAAVPTPTKQKSLSDLGDGEASAVLYIHGDALDRANLMFEDTLIREIPLSLATGLAPSKRGKEPNTVFVVVKTTRSNPGWLDINSSAEKAKFSSDKIPVGDGIFYLMVHDSFGRNTRMDIDYWKWSHRARSDTVNCFVEEQSENHNRWWVRGKTGTDMSGTGPFSYTEFEYSYESTPVNGQCK